ncbi:exodeoxyribonuclease VII large subunit [Martelella sp. HB161492]|uniref:exodeoxyribonuclease VII large subunit n=1 Tax=Martelella sp. HB161492 TaxID=2720726 RepID=UPI001590C724|nr:exodeoxyribonuclease VII large subunit [Martelella sp. HB161492]
MQSLFDNDSATNLPEFTVSELSGAIKRTVEDRFDRIRLRGEISGYRGPHSSGHAYFSLKDERSRIDTVIWRGTFSGLAIKPEEGMEVIVTGRVTTFPGASKYQLVVETLEPAGAGALMALLEERRKKLAAEGLFDEAKKRPLPYMPKVIGVITSPTGAVIRDILHRISDRFPVHVVVWPVKVQGEGSGDQVAAAISGFNALALDGPVARPDLLIVARGGGSLEDLWGFNDEAVVRAVAASTIPLISAVGHETDWTLIDHAADYRAPTPTGAAERAVPVKAELVADQARMAARLASAIGRLMDFRRQTLAGLARGLPSLDQLLALPRRRFDETAMRLTRALELNTINKRRFFEQRASGLAGLPQRLAMKVENARERLHGLGLRADTALTGGMKTRRAALLSQERVLNSLSYRNVLERGFAVIRNADGKPLTRRAAIGGGDRLEIEFADGRLTAAAGESVDTVAVAAEPKPKTAAAKKPVAARSKKDEDSGQGSLF